MRNHMNLSYFRKSTRPFEETAARLADGAAAQGWKKLGDVDLPDGSGKMLLLCRTEWVQRLLKIDHTLIGFLPCAVTVLTKGDDVLVGTGQTAILRSLAEKPEVADLAAQADAAVKSLIHEAAGVGPQKPSRVRLYSTHTCPYCKMEKAWLDEKRVAHEVVYVDQDQREAEEMVRKTGQMGVPVTEVQYEDAEAEFIVGFDRAGLQRLLGL